MLRHNVLQRHAVYITQISILTTQTSIIQVLRSVNKSSHNHISKCDYLQKQLYHIRTYPAYVEAASSRTQSSVQKIQPIL